MRSSGERVLRFIFVHNRMHTLGALAALLVFVVRVLAASNYGGCLTQATTDELVTNFIALTNGGAFNRTLARALIAPDVVDTSGSVASVINGGELPHTFSRLLSFSNNRDRSNWSSLVARSYSCWQTRLHCSKLRTSRHTLSAAQHIPHLQCCNLPIRDCFQATANLGYYYLRDCTSTDRERVPLPD